jgi:hypothetical protein
LSLLQLIAEVAEAFTQERITASHANLIARLPQESQAEAFEQCWRKDWQDSGAASASRQARFRLDSEQPLSLACGYTVRPRRPHPQPRSRSLRHLPTSQRIQHFPLFGRN